MKTPPESWFKPFFFSFFGKTYKWPNIYLLEHWSNNLVPRTVLKKSSFSPSPYRLKVRWERGWKSILLASKKRISFSDQLSHVFNIFLLFSKLPYYFRITKHINLQNTFYIHVQKIVLFRKYDRFLVMNRIRRTFNMTNKSYFAIEVD